MQQDPSGVIEHLATTFQPAKGHPIIQEDKLQFGQLCPFIKEHIPPTSPHNAVLKKKP